LRQNTLIPSLTAVERRRYPIAPARRADPCRWRLSDPDTRCRWGRGHGAVAPVLSQRRGHGDARTPPPAV